MEDNFSTDKGGGGGGGGDGAGGNASDGERWGAADEASLSHPPLTSRCAARFLPGHGLLPVHGPRVGNPCSKKHSVAVNFAKTTFFFFLEIGVYLFIYLFRLCWVFVSVRGLSLVAASGGHSSSRCAGLSLSRPLLLRSTGSRRAGSVVVAHGPSCSAACGIFPDQGSNPCPLHWQADSHPLRHQGSPKQPFLSSL